MERNIEIKNGTIEHKKGNNTFILYNNNNTSLQSILDDGYLESIKSLFETVKKQDDSKIYKYVFESIIFNAKTKEGIDLDKVKQTEFLNIKTNLLFVALKGGHFNIINTLHDVYHKLVLEHVNIINEIIDNYEMYEKNDLEEMIYNIENSKIVSEFKDKDLEQNDLRSSKFADKDEYTKEELTEVLKYLLIDRYKSLLNFKDNNISK